MKKSFKSILVIALSAICALGAIACSPKPDEGSGGDDSKSQLLVYNYNGGVGSVWLDKVIDRFEEKFADYSFEPGKLGVEVTPTKTKDNATLNHITTTAEDVFFSEWVDIPALVSQGRVVDIHDIVTTPLNEVLEGRTTDTESIEDKLYQETIDFFTFKDNKYYGLPHYANTSVFTYNKALFDTKGLYFAKTAVGTELPGKFIDGTNTVKSCGPDGLTGIVDGVDYSEDDGLPATWDEMFDLFNYMKIKSVTPFIFTGKDAVGYTKGILNNAYLNLVGAKVARYNYTLYSGTETINIVTGWESNAADALPTVGTSIVEASNPDVLNKQLEKYQAFTIYDEMVDTGAWQHDACTNTTMEMLPTQYEYLVGCNTGKPTAIIIEAGHWYNEAVDANYLASLRGTYTNFDELNDFRIMPAPRNYKGKASDIEGTYQGKTVVTDLSDSFACISSRLINNESKLKLAKMFLAFCYTQESLAEFTETTGMLRTLKYDYDETKLTDYGRSFCSYYKNSDLLFSYSSNLQYISNKTKLSLHGQSTFWNSAYTGGETPWVGLKGANKEVKAFFTKFMIR